jgi:hypothetical protein
LGGSASPSVGRSTSGAASAVAVVRGCGPRWGRGASPEGSKVRVGEVPGGAAARSAPAAPPEVRSVSTDARWVGAGGGAVGATGAGGGAMPSSIAMRLQSVGGRLARAPAARAAAAGVLVLGWAVGAAAEGLRGSRGWGRAPSCSASKSQLSRMGRSVIWSAGSTGCRRAFPTRNAVRPDGHPAAAAPWKNCREGFPPCLI